MVYSHCSVNIIKHKHLHLSLGLLFFFILKSLHYTVSCVLHFFHPGWHLLITCYFVGQLFNERILFRSGTLSVFPFRGQLVVCYESSTIHCGGYRLLCCHLWSDFRFVCSR